MRGGEGWEQGYFTSGYFLESQDNGDTPYLKKIENKKLLTGVQNLGLLSKAEKAGLTLSKAWPPQGCCFPKICLF